MIYQVKIFSVKIHTDFSHWHAFSHWNWPKTSIQCEKHHSVWKVTTMKKNDCFHTESMLHKPRKYSMTVGRSVTLCEFDFEVQRNQHAAFTCVHTMKFNILSFFYLVILLVYIDSIYTQKLFWHHSKRFMHVPGLKYGDISLTTVYFGNW